MIGQLGYPRELLVVEKKLSSLPHLQLKGDLPNRRADLLCFGKNIHPDYALFPLLLIECKEGPVERQAEEQALGYNHYVQAPYVALANEKGPFLIFPIRLNFLPSYSQLIANL